MSNIMPVEYGELKLVGSRYLAEYDCLSAEIKGKIRAYMREIIQKNELQSCTQFQVPWGIILDEGGYFFGKRIMVSHQKALIEMIGVILREQGLARKFVIFNNTEVENGQWTVAFVF